jgi:hypothetical protein
VQPPLDWGLPRGRGDAPPRAQLTKTPHANRCGQSRKDVRHLMGRTDCNRTAILQPALLQQGGGGLRAELEARAEPSLVRGLGSRAQQL